MSDASEQVERVLAEADRPLDATAEDGLEPDLTPDRTRQFTHVSLSRMRTEWPEADKAAIQSLMYHADEAIKEKFGVALAIIERLRRHVRMPLADGDGVLLTYDDGTPRWETDEFGVPVEDWGRLNDGDRLNLMGTISTHLYEWEMLNVSDWGEAMFAKVDWELAFSRGYRSMPGHQVSGRPTIDDRTQYGHFYSGESRYFGVYRSILSRKAEVVVRSMTRVYYFLEKTSPR